MIKKHYYSWTDVEQMCTQIVNQIGGQNGFVGLIAILLILAIFQRSK